MAGDFRVKGAANGGVTNEGFVETAGRRELYSVLRQASDTSAL